MKHECNIKNFNSTTNKNEKELIKKFDEMDLYISWRGIRSITYYQAQANKASKYLLEHFDKFKTDVEDALRSKNEVWFKIPTNPGHIALNIKKVVEPVKEVKQPVVKQEEELPDLKVEKVESTPAKPKKKPMPPVVCSLFKKL